MKHTNTVNTYRKILEAAYLLLLIVLLLFRRKKKKCLRFLVGQKHRSWGAFFSSFYYVTVFGSMWPGIPVFGILPIFHVGGRSVKGSNRVKASFGHILFLCTGRSVKGSNRANASLGLNVKYFCRGAVSQGIKPRSPFFFFFSLIPSHLLSSHLFSSSLPFFSTQIRGS